MQFVPDYKIPETEAQTALWFIFDKGKLLVNCQDDHYHVLKSTDVSDHNLLPVDKQFLGAFNGQDCYASGLQPGSDLNDGFEWKDLRALFGRLPEDLIWIAGRANQLVNWRRTHRYCGACGRLTEEKQDERALICPSCGLINYPRLSPAVIVAVVKDREILLARNHRFRGPFYSVLAGFVEPGESLEECIHREVREEVGLSVRNIRYFGSQPWPFPDSLMIGFVADYADGEITVDGSELIEAGWYRAECLPNIPPKMSIARKLIDWFVENRNQK